MGQEILILQKHMVSLHVFAKFLSIPLSYLYAWTVVIMYPDIPFTTEKSL